MLCMTGPVAARTNLNDGYRVTQGTDPVWVVSFELYNLTASDLSLEVHYAWNFTTEERLRSATLFLSLDNTTWIDAQHHEFNASDAQPNGTALFWLANSIGDPFPFDIASGQTIYGYVTFVTTLTSYTSDIYFAVAMMDIQRPLWYVIPRPVIVVLGAVLTVLPLMICGMIVWRRRSDSTPP